MSRSRRLRVEDGSRGKPAAMSGRRDRFRHEKSLNALYFDALYRVSNIVSLTILSEILPFRIFFIGFMARTPRMRNLHAERKT
jgi:hypothetical protein